MQRHRFEPVSLLFGVIFAGAGLLVLLGGDLWRVNWSWFWPAALTLGGLAVLLSARPKRNSDDDGADQGSGAGDKPLSP